MLVFRILCAGTLVWAVAWVLSRPEAAQLVRQIPEIGALGPIAAAYVGGFNLAVRQGWGLIVALANGVWAGTLAIVASGVLYTAVEMARAVREGDIRGSASFFEVFGETLDVLLAQLGNLPLLTLSLAATACAGMLTELLHWLMVRVRERLQRSS